MRELEELIKANPELAVFQAKIERILDNTPEEERLSKVFALLADSVENLGIELQILQGMLDENQNTQAKNKKTGRQET